MSVTGLIPMCDDISTQKNVMLDQILADRRSHRMFRPEPCSEDEIRRILHAGLLAPFAAAAVGNSHDYFRRFFVIRNGSESMKGRHPAREATDREDVRRAGCSHEEQPSPPGKGSGLRRPALDDEREGVHPRHRGLPRITSWLPNGRDFPRSSSSRWRTASRTCG